MLVCLQYACTGDCATAAIAGLVLQVMLVSRQLLQSPLVQQRRRVTRMLAISDDQCLYVYQGVISQERHKLNMAWSGLGSWSVE